MKRALFILTLCFSAFLKADVETLPSLEIQEPKPVIFEQPYKSPFISVSLSTIFPGLGHLYLGDSKTASAFAGTVGISALGMSLGSIPEITDSSMAMMQNTWFYGIYSTYRDVRIYNGNAGFRYPMPTDSLKALTYAPINPKIMKKPEVWGGIIGGFALAIGTTVLANHYMPASLDTSSGSRINPLVALPVGVGEETFFRGYLQSRLAESLTPWGGIAASSILFAAAHIPNAVNYSPQDQGRYYAFSLPLIGTMGAYFGWLTYKNNSLQESVAIHTWYDFILFTGSLLASRASLTPPPQKFAISFPF